MIENRLVKQQISIALDKYELLTKINPSWLMRVLRIWEDEYNCTHESDEVTEWYCQLDYSECFKPEYKHEYKDDDSIIEEVFVPVSGLLMDIVGINE